LINEKKLELIFFLNTTLLDTSYQYISGTKFKIQLKPGWMDATCSVVILDTRHTQKNLVYYFFLTQCCVQWVCVYVWVDGWIWIEIKIIYYKTLDMHWLL